MPSADRDAELAALEQKARDAVRRGNAQEAVDAWARIVSIQPDHVLGLTQLGQAAYRQGDFEAAQVAFQRVVAADGREAPQWINLALACKQRADPSGEEAALFKALSLDPYDFMALLLRGNLQERQGKPSHAAASYGAAATLAPPRERLNADLQSALDRASSYLEQYNHSLAAFLDQQLEPHARACGAAALDRFKLSVDILVGRKRRFIPQPMRYFMPQLPVIEFFERSDFPWLDAVEAAWQPIRDEFLAVLQADEGFVPYIGYGADQPVAQWAELNHSPRWSAFHLVKEGQRVVENAARCPVTMGVWEQTPWPDQPGRTPVAMYSLLKRRTRIPSHVGASNCRLVTHLPLIVPPGCGFRVGNQTREWVPGKAWVFDDTIEHEAWNHSDQLRVVLIFDTWHPMLGEAERRMITALNAALNAFSSSSASGYDV
jgi:aspartyl/asparaginyl beta-hydroxylase (cupin superfamily)